MHHEPSRVERKRDARTSAILDEAMKILESEGLEALTLGRLARSLDLVPAALYRYFDSKDALLAALQRRAIGVIHTRLRETTLLVAERSRRLSPDVGALAKLLGATHLYLALPRTEPQTYFLVALLVGDPRPLLSDDEAKRTGPVLFALLQDVEVLFREATQAGALAKGDSFERTLAFWSMLQGALALEKMRRLAPALPSPSDVAASSVATLLGGWGADGAALKRARKVIDERGGKS